MFPNVRVMIAAIIASLLGMSCGLAVFAAFSVNHDPFVRPPSSAPPLPLVLGYAAPGPEKDAAAPFGVRFPLNVPTGNGVPANIPIVAHEDVAAPAEPSAEAPAAVPAAPNAPDESAKANNTTMTAVETPAEPAASEATTTQVSKPAPQREAAASVKTRTKSARQGTKRQHVAVKHRRLRKAHPTAVATYTDRSAVFSTPGYPFTPVPQSQFTSTIRSQPVQIRRLSRNSATGAGSSQ
jgi:hypothetical protein